MINKSSFVEEIFLKQFAPKLDKRRNTFLKVFEILEKQQKENYLIIETGCARAGQNWEGDGQSTLMFDSFVSHYGGEVHTVDINENSCAFARSVVGEKTTVHCNDSVDFLWNCNFNRAPDLLYLDSYDLNKDNPHPSAMHHIKELLAAMRFLSDETLIVIDDNLGNGIFKGSYVEDFMADIKAEKLFNRYQVAWRLNREPSAISNLSQLVAKYIFLKYVPIISKTIDQNINVNKKPKKLLVLRSNSKYEITFGWDKINQLNKDFSEHEITTIASFDAEALDWLKRDNRISNILMFPATKNERKSWASWYALTRKHRFDIVIFTIFAPPSGAHFKHLVSLLFCSGKKYIWCEEKQPQPLLSIRGVQSVIKMTSTYIESVKKSRKKM